MTATAGWSALLFSIRDKLRDVNRSGPRRAVAHFVIVIRIKIDIGGSDIDICEISLADFLLPVSVRANAAERRMVFVIALIVDHASVHVKGIHTVVGENLRFAGR